jgi:2-polyprenyl-3-methyl-5-hydroxy-6-metoxy-1,4-benzoquinol methylase
MNQPNPQRDAGKARLLVAIASYGNTNNKYLAQLIDEYKAMSFEVDIVVLTNLEKEVRAGVELQIVPPGKNPWTLPFAHKKIFAERLEKYDLFIYTEDDVLITEKNLQAFLKVSEVLPANVIAGFIRYELAPDGTVSYPEVHGHSHWDPESVQSFGGLQFAHFTNEHSACYVVAREQLRRAIDSGGFLIDRWDGKYDLICTAATDAYIHCGFKKLICISLLEEFSIQHLSGKYSDIHFHVDGPEMRRQIEALLRIGQNGHRPGTLFQTETKLRGGKYSKGYYEPAMPQVLSMMPANTRNVLSLGCGWGAIEAKLAGQGIKVTAVPLDVVIPGGAKAGSVEIVEGDFDAARRKLEGRKFDCLLVSNVLHLVDDPIKILTAFADLLSPGSSAIIVVPNLMRLKATYDLAKKDASYAHERLPVSLMKMFGDKWFRNLGSFEATGVRMTSHRILRHWSNAAGLKLVRTIDLLPRRAQKASRLTLRLLDHVFADEIIAVAKRQ